MATESLYSVAMANSAIQNPSPFLVAELARRKMAKESSRYDYNLRLLVGHANTIDHLEVVISEAQRNRLQDMAKYALDNSPSHQLSSTSSTLPCADHSSIKLEEGLDTPPKRPAPTVIQVTSVSNNDEDDSDSSSSDEDRAYESDDEGFDLGLQEMANYLLHHPSASNFSGLKHSPPELVTVTETEVCD